MKKTLILLGGNLYQGRGYQKEKFDYVIAADGGLIAAEKMGILPTHIVGDFDTVPKEMVDFYQKKNIPVRIFQPEKDMTWRSRGRKREQTRTGPDIIPV